MRQDTAPPDLREIVAGWLREHGYEGLYREHGCGCKVDDLMPCVEPHADCLPGYVLPCDPETCENGGECEWHIGPKKEAEHA